MYMARALPILIAPVLSHLPFLKTLQIFAFFQSIGNMPIGRDFVKRTVRTGEISSAYCLINGRISSGLLALFVLRSYM